MEQEWALLSERLPPQILDVFGAEMVQAILDMGLNRRTALLTLTRPLLQDLPLPRSVGALLHAFWAARNGAALALPRMRALLPSAEGMLHAVFTQEELAAVRQAAGACAVYQRARRFVQQAEQEEKAVLAAAWPQHHRAHIYEPTMLLLFDDIVLEGHKESERCLCQRLQ